MSNLPATTDMAGLERLQHAPIIDQIDERTRALIKAQVAKDCTDAEVGYFLELAAHYDLDPFAREIWCVKNREKLLIMVGRDGLRKVAQRQGFRIDGDVVHEKDEFKVVRTGEGREIHHDYAKPAERGAVIGAWSQVTDQSGVEHGYFFAPLSEYMPSNVNQYSPWAKQTSVMILAASERQACRQATPLAGLLVQGEEESVAAPALSEGTGSGEARGVELGPEVERILARAMELGHQGLADRATAEMSLDLQPPEFVTDWVRRADAELDAMESGEPEVVDGEAVDELSPGERATVLQAEALAKLEEAEAAEADGDEERGDALRSEALGLKAAADALGTPEQEAMDL